MKIFSYIAVAVIVSLVATGTYVLAFKTGGAKPGTSFTTKSRSKKTPTSIVDETGRGSDATVQPSSGKTPAEVPKPELRQPSPEEEDAGRKREEEEYRAYLELRKGRWGDYSFAVNSLAESMELTEEQKDRYCEVLKKRDVQFRDIWDRYCAEAVKLRNADPDYIDGEAFGKIVREYRESYRRIYEEEVRAAMRDVLDAEQYEEFQPPERDAEFWHGPHGNAYNYQIHSMSQALGLSREQESRCCEIFKRRDEKLAGILKWLNEQTEQLKQKNPDYVLSDELRGLQTEYTRRCEGVERGEILAELKSVLTPEQWERYDLPNPEDYFDME